MKEMVILMVYRAEMKQENQQQEILSESATRLAEFCGSEAQGIALARIINCTRHTPDDVLEEMVCDALVRVRLQVDELPELTYQYGSRRDTLRDSLYIRIKRI